MNENMALILSLVVIVVSIGAVLFFKNKYSKQISTTPLSNNNEIELLKQEYLEKEKNYAEKLKSLESTQSVILEDKRLALENIKKLESEQANILEDKKVTLEKFKQLEAEQSGIIEEKRLALESFKQIESEQAIILEEKRVALAKILEQEQAIEEKLAIVSLPAEITIKSILVVDDSSVVRNKMKKLLDNAGYDVTTANDGFEALNALPTKHFDLVITDLEMPNLDGFGLITKMHENPETKDLPVMAITGHEEMKIRISECEGLYSVQKKPWKDNTILKKVALLSSIKRD